MGLPQSDTYVSLNQNNFLVFGKFPGSIMISGKFPRIQGNLKQTSYGIEGWGFPNLIITESKKLKSLLANLFLL